MTFIRLLDLSGGRDGRGCMLYSDVNTQNNTSDYFHLL